MKPVTFEAYQLLRDGLVEFSGMEANGICVDVERLTANIQEVEGRVKQLTAQIRQTDVWRLWLKIYGGKANMGSRPQLARILFKELGFKGEQNHDTNRYILDEATLANIDHPFCKMFLEIERWKKLHGTFLLGLQREVCDGYLHSFFNLHIARTYRSSSDSINFQNIPIRDQEVGAYIRSCFIPRGKDRVLVELDYSGVEVLVAACYHKDPTMIQYIENPGKDMHRDMAAQCYKLKPKQVTKQLRYCGKNMFVFPEFYGSYYAQCAVNLWNALDSMSLTLEDGTRVKDHLAAKGVTKLGSVSDYKPEPGTFMDHLKDVEDDFWGRRFQVYGRWREDWFESYLKNGGFNTLTGFRIDGIYGRNDVINYPIQGSAFHCLLWSFIQISRQLRRRKMDALLVGQIHDSILADVHVSCVQDYLILAKEIMVDRLMEHWKWIIVNLKIEAEVTPVGGSWHDKKKVDDIYKFAL